MPPTPEIPLVRPDLPPLERYVAALEEIWSSGMLSNFSRCATELEELSASYFGEARVLSAASCDLGLTLAVAALELPAGSEAVMPSFAFPSTAAAARWNGLSVRFADVEPGGWCLDPDALARSIGPDTSLVVATHMFGTACDVDALDALTRERGVALIYDAAQAIGTFAAGGHVAGHGDAAVFSLGGTKVATSAEGGLAVFRDPTVAERFARLRTHGMDGGLVAHELGLNAKLSELHAALGCLTLKTVEDSIAARARLTERYRERLEGRVEFQSDLPGTRPSRSFLAIDAGPRRDALADHLAAEGVETRSYFRPLHSMPPFENGRPPELPVTERLAASVLCLPLHPALPEADVDRVCALVRAELG